MDGITDLEIIRGQAIQVGGILDPAAEDRPAVVNDFQGSPVDLDLRRRIRRRSGSFL
jgi:hypothetical protein